MELGACSSATGSNNLLRSRPETRSSSRVWVSVVLCQRAGQAAESAGAVVHEKPLDRRRQGCPDHTAVHRRQDRSAEDPEQVCGECQCPGEVVLKLETTWSRVRRRWSSHRQSDIVSFKWYYPCALESWHFFPA